MDRTEFEQALRKGLGRAVQFLRANDSAPYHGPILAACLEDWRYDPQTNDSRSLYLYEVIQAAREPDFVRSGLIEHLETCEIGHLLPENSRLSYEFAVRDDGRMRGALYHAFGRSAAEQDFTCADEILKLDGMEGFIHVCRRYLGSHEESDDWLFGAWIEDLEERDGAEETRRVLDETAKSWPAFLEALESHRSRRIELERKKWNFGNGPLLPWREMREALIAKKRPDGVGGMTWGRRADEENLRLAAEDVARENDPNTLLRLLDVFRERPFPLPPGPLLNLVNTAETKLAWRAALVLSKVNHPDVREQALQLARDGRLEFAAQLLEANWQAGDEGLLLDMIVRCADENELHHVGMSVLDISQAHPVEEMDAPLLLLYEKGNCAMCREGVVRALLKRNALPPATAEECLCDASLDIREMVREALAGGEQRTDGEA